MLATINSLKNERVLSIDAFRGITFFIMIIVNELAGVDGISIWLKHMPAEADAMSFPDIVFPAFLFIVGMSIPFSMNHRIMKGDSMIMLNQHIAIRALALIVMGFFMVNAEGNFHAASMPFSIHLWSLISYFAFLLIWGVYAFQTVWINQALYCLGIALLTGLFLVYRGGYDGSEMMMPQWWGILGLIGWAYLLSCWLYQLSRGRTAALLLLIAVCIAAYALLHQMPTTSNFANAIWYRILISLDGHLAHSAIVLCGVVTSVLFFEKNTVAKQSRRFIDAILFAFCLFLAATWLRQDFPISKIYASPSWCFYSAAICVLFFCVLYWLIDIRHQYVWFKPVQAAAVNPLICYLIPFVVEALLKLLDLPSPIRQFEGMAGILAAILYAFLVIGVVHQLNRFNFRIKF
ncbi:DUF5009 domain-containing protein [Undibacterium fentianense]|uniref:DUF5009 domain-containing protein n=1 Tax=Undibacterium fentianense TaxID=2828728 RepID=A0A941IFD7_9BURK|nr:DUF5009 domain-containing protein [Undibacterium fentianense]MBR7800267.1 DUF5009 domain-containing protein [Undibacterium fentianense]